MSRRADPAVPAFRQARSPRHGVPLSLGSATELPPAAKRRASRRRLVAIKRCSQLRPPHPAYAAARRPTTHDIPVPVRSAILGVPVEKRPPDCWPSAARAQISHARKSEGANQRPEELPQPLSKVFRGEEPRIRCPCVSPRWSARALWPRASAMIGYLWTGRPAAAERKS